MINEVRLNFIKILRLDKKIGMFLLWVAFGLGFSMSVILSTIGLMEGFERDLLSALKKSNGDFSVNGSFSSGDVELIKKHLLKKYPSLTTKSFLKSEVFLVGKRELSKGAVILSTDFKENKLFALRNLSTNPGSGEAIVGEDLGKELKLNVGDSFRVLMRQNDSNGFSIRNFKVADYFKTNLYEKDSRFVYIDIDEFSSHEETVFNHLIFDFNFPYDSFSLQKERIEVVNDELYAFDENLYAVPYWDDYATLIDAVEIEKNSILLVLQIIVVVSVFNLVSFLIFFREKKIKELFTLHALGLSPREINRIWFKLSTVLWLCAVVVSNILVLVFGKILVLISENIMPKNIYHLGTINLYLSLENYVVVYTASLCWIFLMTFLLVRKFRADSLLRGLRQQYA